MRWWWKLRKVRLNRTTGYSGYRLGTYSVLSEYVESMYPNHYKMDLVRPGSRRVAAVGSGSGAFDGEAAGTGERED